MKCPICGKEHATYKTYFACWSSHLDAESAEPLTHRALIQHYYQSPNMLENGMRSVGVEVGVFRGRIDLVLRDRAGRLCLVDITTGKDIKRKVDQLRRYREDLVWLANNVFKVKLPEPVRLFTVHARRGAEEIT